MSNTSNNPITNDDNDDDNDDDDDDDGDDNDNDDDDDDQDNDDQPSSHQQTVKTKIIKCKTNNQLIQMPSYNILTSNGSSSTNLRTIDSPNEHTSIKLHIRRVCSPPSTDSASIHPTSNLLMQSSNEFNEISTMTTKIFPRKFFNSNETSIQRRLVSTRRTSLVEPDSYHTSSSVYTLSNSLVTNHTSIYDENSLKKPANKRKTNTDPQEKKRAKVNSRTIKQTTLNSSK